MYISSNVLAFLLQCIYPASRHIRNAKSKINSALLHALILDEPGPL